MKSNILTVLLFLSTIGKTQIDSTWLAEQYLPRFYTDTGTYLPATKFVDEQGNEKTLADFKGKILYVDTWTTSCGPCIARFPYEEQLLKRLKVLHLDTTIQFVNLCYDDKQSRWKKALKKYQPVGINLYSTDTALGKLWNLQTFPTYLLLDTDGKVLGKDICSPDDGYIDYILYAATKGIHPVEAIWNEYKQRKLANEQKTFAAYTDADYATWDAATRKSRYEYYAWAQARRQQASKKKK